MTPAALFRTLNITWEPLLWGLFWAVGLIIFFNTLAVMTLIPIIYDWLIKHVMPKWHDGKLGKLQDENNRLKSELKSTIKERDGFEARLVTISLSSEVRGI